MLEALLIVIVVLSLVVAFASFMAWKTQRPKTVMVNIVFEPDIERLEAETNRVLQSCGVDTLRGSQRGR